MISAAARPMPLLEPVMTATWPERSKGFCMALACLPVLYVNLLPRPRCAPRVAAIIVPELERQQQGRQWERNDPGRRAIRPACAGTRRSRWRRCRRCSMPSPRSGRAKPALEYRDRKISYAELRAGVDAVASGLMDLGVGPGTSVALYLPNTPYHPLSFFAALKAGGRHRAPLPARCRAGARLQARRTPARASWSPPTSASWLLLAQKLQRDGLVDHLIVGDDTAFGPSAIPTTPIADGAAPSCASTSCARRAPSGCRGNGRRSTSRTSRCCNTPAAPRASPRAPC